MRHLLIAFIVVGIFVIPWMALTFPDTAETIAVVIREAGDELAAVILSRKPVTVEELKNNYNSSNQFTGPKLRILIVPGHEPEYGGAEYGNLKERNLNLELARSLIGFLNNDSHYQVFTTRTDAGWTPEFANYFKNNRADILAWSNANKQEAKTLMSVGGLKAVVPTVYHNRAPEEVGIRLLGINKWATDNKIDIVIHIHFNDYPRDDASVPGKYSGFSIYVPEKQYYNSTTTKALAETVFLRLKKYNPVSNYLGEAGGIVEDQDLIAIGSHNSMDAASMLVEYSYLYEPQFQNPDVRSVFLKEAAYETYVGLMDFFEPNKAASLAHTFDTLVLPHRWNTSLTGKGDSVLEVFALQTALIMHGSYPPSGWTMNECPRTGKFGPCTKKALGLFQSDFDIRGEQGVAGPETLDQLNSLYSADVIRAI